MLIDDLKIGDLTNIITSAACVFLAWQQNRIFEHQNRIIAGESGGLPMLHAAPRRNLRQYWPTVIMAALICVTGYDYYDRHARAASLGGSPLPWWILIIAVALGFLIGKVVGARAPARGTSTVEWRQGFSQPRFEIVDDHKFENEEIVVDNKSFRRCSFKNVKLFFHGHAPFEFVEGTVIDLGTVFFNTDDPAVMVFNTMQTRFSSLPEARVQHRALDSKGKDVPLAPLTVEPMRRFPRKVFTVQRVLAEPHSTSPSVVYKDKIRVILTNHLDIDVQVWTPTWNSPDVLPQQPFGSLLRLEGPKGWNFDDWQAEVPSCNVPVGCTVSCWIGLLPPSGQSIERRVQTNSRVGTAIFPVKIGGKLYEDAIDL